MLDSGPHVRQARAEQATFANMTMFLLFLCACALLAFMAVRYRAARDRLNLLTMRSVSQLRFLPGGEQ